MGEALIRLERDPAFWRDIASADEVAEALMGMPPEMIGEIAQNPTVLPFAGPNGGFLFARMDGFGFAWEMHAVFRRAGWGGEAIAVGLYAAGYLFSAGAAMIMTYEVDGNRRSRPPASAGFAPAGDWAATPVGPLKPWVLLRAAWEASRMGRKACPQQ